MEFDEINKRIKKAIREFNKKIPGIERGIYREISSELRRLDLRQGNIKPTVANLKIIVSIKNKISRLILTDDYIADVKEFIKAFNEITQLQHAYWRAAVKEFRPRPLLKEIRKQAITNTVKRLTDSIGVTIGDKLGEMLTRNVTTGGSIKQLDESLRKALASTDEAEGLLTKNTKQITVDSINQFNAQYTQAISDDLGFEWYAFQGTEIMTSRPFCQHMVEERRYFHITEIPDLLAAKDMYYIDNKTEEKKKVTLNPDTKLPYGFYPETNISNFMILRGGYNCGHIIRPVLENNVKFGAKEVYDRIINSEKYILWRKSKE